MILSRRKSGDSYLAYRSQIEREQIQRLQALRAKRDSNKAKAAVVELERRAATQENLMPASSARSRLMLRLAKFGCAGRSFGEYRESVVI